MPMTLFIIGLLILLVFNLWVVASAANQLFKAMVHLKYDSLSEPELNELYPALCDKFGFKEV
jgi:hypothetical protein